MVGAVGHDVVYIMRVLPPTNADAVAEVAGHEADDAVPLARMRDTTVPCVVPEKRSLAGTEEGVS